ncbi:chromosomal organization and dna repair protein [Rutstroemia sp. NJR-2017a WRK4]|nr:chromosomal organization and dna repair protein [Rutstroemia sp. NJR-2017a WRK4]
MSARKRLHQRNPNPAPAPVPSYQPIPFPTYTPPTCPLSLPAQRSLASIRSTRNIGKLKKHLEAAIQNVTDTTVENNDRLQARIHEVERLEKKRRRQEDGEGENEGLERRYAEMEKYKRQFGKRVDVWTQEAEKAMRQLIDTGDEVAVQEGLLEGVVGRVALGRGEEEEDEDGERKVVVSAVELLFEAKEDYKRRYEGESMTKRYAQNNSYRTFKRVVHDAQHPEADAPALGKESTWFPQDQTSGSGAGATAESSDDDIEIQREVKDLKCPLTLMPFRHPYTNGVCNHSFEKEAIIEYHGNSAVLRDGVRVVKCPAVGCENMISLKDMYDDQVLSRQVKRAEQRANREYEEDEDEDVPRGTQRRRPEEIEDESGFLDGGVWGRRG